MQEILNKFNTDVKESGATLIMVVIPQIWQIDKIPQDRFKNITKEMGLPIDLEEPVKRLNKMAKKNKWLMLNLYEIFKEKISPKPAYEGIGPENHWSLYTQEVTAQAICEFIENEVHLKRSPSAPKNLK